MLNWMTVTDLGNAALVIPAAGIILGWLVVQGHRTQALAWAGTFAAGVLLVAVTKIAFLGFGLGSATLPFSGASGHTMMATAVFAMLGRLLGRGGPHWQAALATATGCAVGLAVGASRLALGCHSPAEVAAGGLIGLACALVPGAGSPRQASSPLAGRGLVAVGILVLSLLLHDVRVPTHDWLIQAALILSGRDSAYGAPA